MPFNKDNAKQYGSKGGKNNKPENRNFSKPGKSLEALRKRWPGKDLKEHKLDYERLKDE